MDEDGSQRLEQSLPFKGIGPFGRRSGAQDAARSGRSPTGRGERPEGRPPCEWAGSAFDDGDDHRHSEHPKCLDPGHGALMPKAKGVFAEIDCEGYRRESRACSQQGGSNLFPAHTKILPHCAAPHNRPMTVPACGRIAFPFSLWRQETRDPRQCRGPRCQLYWTDMSRMDMTTSHANP
jgi:hypothetical protein